jgi:hypothetical protein
VPDRTAAFEGEDRVRTWWPESSSASRTGARCPPAFPIRSGDCSNAVCTKDARERLRDIGEARITSARGAHVVANVADAPGGRAPRPPRAAVVMIALDGVVACHRSTLLLAGPIVLRSARVTRLAVITPSADESFGNPRSYAISPDGGSLVFVQADSHGYRASAAALARSGRTRRIEGTKGAVAVLVPDSRDFAFFADGRLRRVPARGARANRVRGSQGRGGSWSGT